MLPKALLKVASTAVSSATGAKIYASDMKSMRIVMLSTKDLDLFSDLSRNRSFNDALAKYGCSVTQEGRTAIAISEDDDDTFLVAISFAYTDNHTYILIESL